MIESLEFKIRFLAQFCPEVATVKRVYGLIESKFDQLEPHSLLILASKKGILLVYIIPYPSRGW